MRRLPLWIVCSAMAVSVTAAASNAGADTSVSINMRVGDPYRGPSLEFRHEPDVVLVPDSRVYYVRDYDYDIYRYGSYWYFTYDGGWYRARRYNGRYVYVGYESVPSRLWALQGGAQGQGKRARAWPRARARKLGDETPQHWEQPGPLLGPLFITGRPPDPDLTLWPISHPSVR
ncbi:MAG: hypothetical protein E6K77_07410 [Candidatus Eisenbacteria bacterium]|uniref:Uncharacterized protein n=1 Tax=Eiseniibacteriota bacterium TaxID=2212470 RepID=A0A538TFS2_UNCEI|nr:MAG: hypothetical protein E6K77_07410 [Candidatus Eisenbacteria bacterium]